MPQGEGCFWGTLCPSTIWWLYLTPVPPQHHKFLATSSLGLAMGLRPIAALSLHQLSRNPQSETNSKAQTLSVLGFKPGQEEEIGDGSVQLSLER